MSSMYDLETTDFALSSEGLHLMRSRFNYKTISYDKITKATSITRTSEIKNVMLALVIGCAFIAFAVLQSLYVIDLFNDPTVYRISVESIVVPVLPGAVGGYLVYASLKKGPVLIVHEANARHKLRLKELAKDGDMTELISYLSEKLNDRFRYSDI